ncbi:helix-turn-helix transcriptional regulator [Streptacidiphilus sp. ASG 303]|uniref:helix-turn-helix transcriptional regulator n=1 Tax=Streptacidiphilus sp. ASG 303 TaxID=2896847 RepID=UPI0035B269F1
MRGPGQRPGAGVTQEQMARAPGISLRHYGALEAGAGQPSFALLAGLVRLLRLDDAERLALLDALLDAQGPGGRWELPHAC